jgi:hypothetical protein
MIRIINALVGSFIIWDFGFNEPIVHRIGALFLDFLAGSASQKQGSDHNSGSLSFRYNQAANYDKLTRGMYSLANMIKSA